MPPITSQKRANDVSPILFVKQLPYEISTEKLYEIFGKYGAIRQIRLGDSTDTKGKAFVVYEDVSDAQLAQRQLHGYNIDGRYLVITFFKPPRKIDTKEKSLSEKSKAELEDLRSRYGVAS